jgi:hypothetical protein
LAAEQIADRNERELPHQCLGNGALVSLSMISSPIGNILVQPALIQKLDRRAYEGVAATGSAIAAS